ncbi:MAG: SPOR domain-containing protein [Gammaproteobacteria bacterium]|nr:SPOR domain-containing protein [Gammaproteobacteria bacterium]MDH4313752.1 SPOR domain-containing protein [Gammaproteobacteria bacterium]MDH5213472.1 SPOR domain-containing protein [Gammaproteobacteria bacterium]
MRNLLLLLLLANILYYLWGRFVDEPPETGVATVMESQLGPSLEVSRTAIAEAATSVGAVLGSGRPSDLSAVVGRSCVSIGPFKSNVDANGALAEYAGEGMRASVRTTQGQIFVGYWVQIRNIPDRETGNAMLEKLKVGGLGDAYLVPTDDEGLKISLGLFGDMSRAERVELQARSLELPADISQRTREDTVFYVDIALSPGRGAGAMIEKYGEEKVLLREAATCPRQN